RQCSRHEPNTGAADAQTLGQGACFILELLRRASGMSEGPMKLSEPPPCQPEPTKTADQPGRAERPRPGETDNVGYRSRPLRAFGSGNRRARQPGRRRFPRKFSAERFRNGRLRIWFSHSWKRTLFPLEARLGSLVALALILA